MAATDVYFPGVQIVEKVFQPGSSSVAPVTSLGAFIGKSDQGPTVPTKVASWAEFTKLYGTNYTDLHYAVNDFFVNSGGRGACYIVRIPGANGVAAELDVFDTAATGTSGTPLFTATALNPGKWGNELKLVTYTRDDANKRFDVALFRVPPSVTTFDPAKRNSTFLVDQWLDVSLDQSDSRYLYDVANTPSTAGSAYVRFSGQSYNPATPAVRPMPGDEGGNDFTGGVDGVYIAPYVEGTAYAAAITAMSEVVEPYVLNMPNMWDATIVKNAVQSAADQGNVFVVVDPQIGRTPAEAVTYANTTLGLGTLGISTPSYAALYYPWVHMPVIGSTSQGRSSLRPPGGAVVGAIIANDVTYGAWKAPAGTRTILAGAFDIERKLTDSDLTILNNAHVNAIRPVGQTSGAPAIAIMGARTLKKFGMDKYVSSRRSIIEIASNLRALTEFAIFESNDARLWTRLQAVCTTYLGAYWQSGGLAGVTADDAYRVRCDATNNTPNAVEQGQVNIEVAVALTAPAEFIVITIGQFEGGGSSVSASV